MRTQLPVLTPTSNVSSRKPAVEILGMGSAVPPLAMTQKDVLDFVRSRFDVRSSTKELYKRTLGHPSINKRYFSLDQLESVLETDIDRINARFQKSAVELSTRALEQALCKAGLKPETLDFLAVATCTGYLCPGLSAYLVERCGLRRDIHIADLVGMGCGAALPSMEQAYNFTMANPGATAAVVCTEICSAAMYSNDDIDIVISNSIFADGSAAVLLKSSAVSKAHLKNGSPKPFIRRFSSIVIPDWRETLRFVSKEGRLKNVLGLQVPQQAAQAIRTIIDDLLQKAEQPISDITHWIMHAGGEKVLNAIEKQMGFSAMQLSSARSVLRNFGNMSSPTVLFVLAEEVRHHPPRSGEWGIISSFGAGFSAHGSLLEWI